MSTSDLTRQIIISGTKELVSKKPFEKISVMEISRKCGINRNTFYYYFKDKYDVAEWILENEISPITSPYMEQGQWSESIIALCNHMKQEKSFYSNALQDSDYRAMRQLLVNYFKQFMIKTAAEHFERLGIQGENREVVARFYSHATVGMICDWVNTGMKKDADFAARMIQLAVRERLIS